MNAVRSTTRTSARTNFRTRYADDVSTGFGNRTIPVGLRDGGSAAGGQRASVTVGYYRNWDGNLTVTDNLEVVPSDYSSYCITAPAAIRDCRAAAATRSAISPTYPGRSSAGRTRWSNKASTFGEQTRVSDFFAVNLSSRFGRGIQFGGGLDTGRTVSDRCFVVDCPAQTAYASRWRRRTAGSRRLQRANANQAVWQLSAALAFMVSGVLQNLSGPQILATYAATERGDRAVARAQPVGVPD